MVSSAERLIYTHSARRSSVAATRSGCSIGRACRPRPQRQGVSRRRPAPGRWFHRVMGAVSGFRGIRRGALFDQRGPSSRISSEFLRKVRLPPEIDALRLAWSEMGLFLRKDRESTRWADRLTSHSHAQSDRRRLCRELEKFAKPGPRRLRCDLLVCRSSLIDTLRRSCSAAGRDMRDARAVETLARTRLRARGRRHDPWEEAGLSTSRRSTRRRRHRSHPVTSTICRTTGVFDEKAGLCPGPLRTERFSRPPARREISKTMWYPKSPASAMQGEVLIVPNGSPFERSKLNQRVALATARARDPPPTRVREPVGGQDELVFDGGSFVVNPDERRHVARLPVWKERRRPCP